MQYYSTNHQAPKVSLKKALTHSEAPDGGLYMPERIPLIPKAFYNNCSEMSFKEIAYVICNMLFGSDIPSATIKEAVDRTLTFPMPLVKLDHDVYALELFHGPSMSVKDTAVGLMARIFRTMHTDRDRRLNMLLATTGNSGSAIANGFRGIEGVNVIVVYPKGVPRSSMVQFASMGDNVHAVEVTGTIDDCAKMVGRAFSDPELNDHLLITSANSINICRILAQTICYFHAYASLLQVVAKPEDIYISVPTGNGGNLLAGYIAMLMGLPVNKLVGACNINGGFHKFLNGAQTERALRSTLAYAMDVSAPANLPRFMELCHGNLDVLRQKIISGISSDADIASTINDVYSHTGYMLDPHSAAAYHSLKSTMPQGATGIVMATAHPARSVDKMVEVTGRCIELPLQLTRFMDVRGADAIIPPTYPALKKFLLRTMSK